MTRGSKRAAKDRPDFPIQLHGSSGVAYHRRVGLWCGLCVKLVSTRKKDAMYEDASCSRCGSHIEPLDRIVRQQLRSSRNVLSNRTVLPGHHDHLLVVSWWTNWWTIWWTTSPGYAAKPANKGNLNG